MCRHVKHPFGYSKTALDALVVGDSLSSHVIIPQKPGRIQTISISAITSEGLLLTCELDPGIDPGLIYKPAPHVSDSISLS